MEEEDPFFCGEAVDEEPETNFTEEYRVLMKSVTGVSKEPEEERIIRRRILTPVKQITDSEIVTAWQQSKSLIHFMSEIESNDLAEMLQRVRQLIRHGVRLKRMDVFSIEEGRTLHMSEDVDF